MIRIIITEGTDCYRQGIEKVITRYDECLTFGWDCPEKPYDISAVKFDQDIVGSVHHLVIYM